MLAQALIQRRTELGALLGNIDKPGEGGPAQGMFHAHRIEADAQLPLMARAWLHVEQIAARRQPADQEFRLDLEVVDQQHLGRARQQQGARAGSAMTNWPSGCALLAAKMAFLARSKPPTCQPGSRSARARQ